MAKWAYSIFLLSTFLSVHFAAILNLKGQIICNLEWMLRKLLRRPITMLSLEMYVHKSSGLEPSLLELVRVRASQINGCAYCIDMHTKDARANGETEQRLYAVSAWEETPFFTDRERAALAWTEAITLISENHAPDALYQKVRERFTEQEIVNLTMAIVAVNGWNRLAIGFRAVPGEYQPVTHKSAEGGKQ